jgi:thiamine biosynthesis lipoprotein
LDASGRRPLDLSSIQAAFAFALCLSAVSAGRATAGESGDLVRVEKADEVMGSTFSVVLYGTDRAKLEAAATAALDEAQRLERMLSNYQLGTEWSRVNSSAALRPVRVSQEMFQLLSACMEYSRQSGGTFDITVGPLMRVWGFYKGEGQLPRRAEVVNALAGVGYWHVRLDPASQTVKFDRPGVELDPGGIGKGYAVDHMVEILKRYGVETALVSGAGSSIYGMGAPPADPQGWRITIRDPHDPHRAAAEVFLKNMSLSTSGSYEKFFWARGRRYAHIMDPRTGYPAQGASSVSVLTPRTIDSEVWAKPYFILGRVWTAANKPKDFRVFFCEDTTGHACKWLP